MSMVAEQLRCAGVVEAVRVARAAYPNRLDHRSFLERFRCALTPSVESPPGADLGKVCDEVLTLLTLKN